MNVYDFDNTLYHGESIFHFACFFVRKNPKCFKYLKVGYKLYRKYKKNDLSLEELENTIFPILESIHISKKEVDNLVDLFWQKKKKNLNQELLSQIKEDDVILSASPTFLLEKLSLPTTHIFASEIDIENKKIEFLCFGENKRKKWRQLYKNKKIDKFYTDSFVDLPLMQISKEVYLVKKGKGTGKKINIRKEK
jgi:phosphoserine phosphatase